MRQSTASQHCASCAAHRIHHPSKPGQASVSFPRLGGGLRSVDRCTARYYLKDMTQKNLPAGSLCGPSSVRSDAEVPNFCRTLRTNPGWEILKWITPRQRLGHERWRCASNGIRAAVHYRDPIDLVWMQCCCQNELLGMSYSSCSLYTVGGAR